MLRALLIVAALAAAGALLWLVRDLATRDASPAGAVNDGGRPRLLPLAADLLPEGHEGPCLPLAWERTAAAPGPAPAGAWMAIATIGERLREDACGAVWGLWGNRWTVFRGDDPRTTAAFDLRSLAIDGDLFYRFGNMSVQDFLFAPDNAIWVAYWNGTLLRGAADGWTTPARLGPGGGGIGRMAWHDNGLWVTRPGMHGPLGLQRWDAASGVWHEVPLPARASFDLVMADSAGRLLGAGPEGLFERAVDGSWRRLADTGGKALALAEHDGRVWLGTDTGLLVVAPDGTTQRVFDGERVEGVVARAGGAAWVALRGKGARWFDGTRWQPWGYQQALTDDDATDLLLGATGWLWVGGKRVVAADVAAAERAVSGR